MATYGGDTTKEHTDTINDLDAKFMEELCKQRENCDGWDSYLELLRETLEHNHSTDDDDDDTDDDFDKVFGNVFAKSQVHQASDSRVSNSESNTNTDSSAKPTNQNDLGATNQSKSNKEKNRHFFKNGTCYFGVPPSDVKPVNPLKEKQQRKQTDSKLDSSELQFYKNLRAYFKKTSENPSKVASPVRSPMATSVDSSSPLSQPQKEHKSPHRIKKESNSPSSSTFSSKECQENGIEKQEDIKVESPRLQTMFSFPEMGKWNLNENTEDASPRREKGTKVECGCHLREQSDLETSLGDQSRMATKEMQDTYELISDSGCHCKQNYSARRQSGTPSESSATDKESFVYTSNTPSKNVCPDSVNVGVKGKEEDRHTVRDSKVPSSHAPRGCNEREYSRSEEHSSTTKTSTDFAFSKTESEKSYPESSSMEQNAKSTFSNEKKKKQTTVKDPVDAAIQSDKEFQFPAAKTNKHREPSLENDDSCSPGQSENLRKRKPHKASEESTERSHKPSSKLHKNRKTKQKVSADVNKECERPFGKMKSNRLSKEEMINKISANERLDSLVGRLWRSGKEAGLSCCLGFVWILYYFLLVQVVIVSIFSLCFFTVTKSLLLTCYEYMASTRCVLFVGEKLWVGKLHMLRWYGITRDFIKEKVYGQKRQAQTYNLPNTAEEAIQQLLMKQGPDENPYRILGVPKEASDDDIRKQYRKLAVLVHPDKNKHPDAAKAFLVLSSAYDVLGDTDKRQQYDQKEVTRKQQNSQGFNKNPAGYTDPHDFFADFMKQMEEIRESLSCDACHARHRRKPTNRTIFDARYCASCGTMHSAKEGDFWKEVRGLLGMGPSKFYTCMEGSIYDITEWGVCQERCGFVLHANTHRVCGKISTRSQHHHPPPRSEEDFLRDLFGGFGTGQHNHRDTSKPKQRRRRKRK